MRTGWFWAAALALAGGTTATAEELRPDLSELAGGYTYYNRPGASLERHNRELADCVQMTVMWQNPEPRQVGGLGDSLVFSLVWGGSIAGHKASRVENCMVTRGWRVVDIGEEEGGGLAKAPIQALIARLSPEVGAETPTGTIVRRWANEGLRPGSYRTTSRGRTPSPRQLSLRLYTETAHPPVALVPPPDLRTIDSVWPKGRLQPSQLGSGPPGSAIILVRTFSSKNGAGIVFSRVGETAEDRPGFRDRAPDILNANAEIFFAKNEGNWFALAVPPGRWRISAANYLSFCFGAPAFEVAAGEIVYAGAFQQEGPELTPDLAMEPALAWLGPEYAARARPAVYLNGSRGDCHGFAPEYALEFPGAGYEVGYDWGSARLLGEAAQ